MSRPAHQGQALLRRAFGGLALLAAVGMAGCGFTPIYGQGGATAQLGLIQVTTPDDRLGYRLREQLEDSLGYQPGQPACWRLETTVQQDRRPLGRRVDDSSVRYELTVSADWRLTPVTGGGAPLNGRETVTTTYSAADQPYAAIAAQQDGEERAAAELARAIRLDILTQLAQP